MKVGGRSWAVEWVDCVGLAEGGPRFGFGSDWLPEHPNGRKARRWRKAGAKKIQEKKEKRRRRRSGNHPGGGGRGGDSWRMRNACVCVCVCVWCAWCVRLSLCVCVSASPAVQHAIGRSAANGCSTITTRARSRRRLPSERSNWNHRLSHQGPRELQPVIVTANHFTGTELLNEPLGLSRFPPPSTLNSIGSRYHIGPSSTEFSRSLLLEWFFFLSQHDWKSSEQET